MSKGSARMVKETRKKWSDGVRNTGMSTGQDGLREGPGTEEHVSYCIDTQLW